MYNRARRVCGIRWGLLGKVYMGLRRANSATAPAGEEHRPVNFSGPLACGSGWGRLDWDAAAPRGCRLGDAAWLVAAWQTSQLAMAHCFPIPVETKFQGEFLGMCTHFPNMRIRACPAGCLHGEKESDLRE